MQEKLRWTQTKEVLGSRELTDEQKTQIAADVKELCAKYRAHDELQWFLMRMIWQGELADALPEAKHSPPLPVLSVANLLGETIWRIHEDSSVSSMFR